MTFFRDIRFGFRTLAKSPGLTAVAVLAITLGIGLTTTVFSIVYGALIKGLPFDDGDLRSKAGGPHGRGGPRTEGTGREEGSGTGTNAG